MCFSLIIDRMRLCLVEPPYRFFCREDNAMTKSVAVLGAGIVGLSTAVRLQSERPELRITLVADSFGEDTASHGAAGILLPHLDMYPNIPTVTLRRWTVDAWNHYDALAKSDEAGAAGVYYMTGYELYDTDNRNNHMTEKEPPLTQKLPPSCRPLTEAEWNLLGCRRQCGWCYVTLLVDPRYHLRWLMDKFLKAGGNVDKRTVCSFEELANYDLVINCTGWGSHKLNSDISLVRNRGQIIRVHAPWLKHWVFLDEDCYIIPCTDHVVVGGTRQQGDEDPTYRSEETNRFLEKACQIVPSLKKAKIHRTWVGFRPNRNGPRIEAEVKIYSGRNLKVVHHYGHGAYGIGLSWGTAVEAVALALTLLDSQAKL